MTASFTSTQYQPDKLLAGETPPESRGITLLSGQNRTRGAVLGKQTASTVPATGTADGGNTGDGTMGSVAAGGPKIQAGTYTARCIAAATDAGDFELIAPDGSVVGIAIVAVAFTSDHLNFTIADGATDFAVGDEFTVAVTGSGKYQLSAAAAVDGSAVPSAVLAEDTDASAADVATVAYFRADLNENEVVLGSGHTLASIRDGMAERGLRLLAATVTE